MNGYNVHTEIGFRASDQLTQLHPDSEQECFPRLGLELPQEIAGYWIQVLEATYVVWVRVAE